MEPAEKRWMCQEQYWRMLIVQADQTCCLTALERMEDVLCRNQDIIF
jgi:hypothetical protein